MSEKIKEGIDCNDSEVKKALESTDISVIERARDMEIGRVTKYVDQIHAILKIDDENGSYSHESISKIELCQAQASLRESFRKVDDLHDWLTSQLLSKAEEASGVYSYAEENRIEEEQSDFIMAVWKKYCEGIISIERYNRACEMEQKEVAMIKDKESFENTKNVGQATANSDDADAKDADAKDADAKVANITDANANPLNAKVIGVDRNITVNHRLKEFNLSKSIEDKLKEKQMQTDVPAIIKKAPEEDVANQFIEFLKIINIDEIKSRKLDVVKLASRVNLQKMISFVVYTTGCITSYSVNMVRWAGRATLVIMNQEEKVSNTDISEDSNDDNYALSDSALGGSKPYKFVLLAKAALVKLVDTSILNTSEVSANLYKVRVFNVIVASLNKFLAKIWAIELEKGLEENESIYKIFQYLFLCEHAVFEESESSDVMKMSAAHTWSLR